MCVGRCIACQGLVEPPFTYAEDAKGRSTEQVICVTCLDRMTDVPEPADDVAELGEGG
jgi:hypothetical protein